MKVRERTHSLDVDHKSIQCTVEVAVHGVQLAAEAEEDIRRDAVHHALVRHALDRHPPVRHAGPGELHDGQGNGVVVAGVIELLSAMQR